MLVDGRQQGNTLRITEGRSQLHDEVRRAVAVCKRASRKDFSYSCLQSGSRACSDTIAAQANSGPIVGVFSKSGLILSICSSAIRCLKRNPICFQPMCILTKTVPRINDMNSVSPSSKCQAWNNKLKHAANTALASSKVCKPLPKASFRDFRAF